MTLVKLNPASVSLNGTKTAQSGRLEGENPPHLLTGRELYWLVRGLEERACKMGNKGIWGIFISRPMYYMGDKKEFRGEREIEK